MGDGQTCGGFLRGLWLLWGAAAAWKEHLVYHLVYRYPREIQCFFLTSLLFFLDNENLVYAGV